MNGQALIFNPQRICSLFVLSLSYSGVKPNRNRHCFAAVSSRQAQINPYIWGYDPPKEHEDERTENHIDPWCARA
jgi:hypothetical protein